MLARVDPRQLSKLPHQEEEHRLINELTRIDQHLRNKTDTRQFNEKFTKWDIACQDQPFSKDKWHEGKDSQQPFICTKNMEYFSQICNQAVEDDSLFDPHDNFLTLSKPPQPHSLHEKDQMGASNPLKKDIKDRHTLTNSSKNSQPQLKFQSSSQILKERDYVYRKESMDRSSQGCRVGLPPKSSKMVNSKSSNILPKNQNRKSISNIQGMNKGIDNHKKQISPNGHPLMKEIHIEEDSLSGESNEFKFHTFQTLLQNQVSSKNVKKHKNIIEQDHQRFQLECTFKPNILKKSQKMVKSTQNVVQRLSTSGQGTKRDKKPYKPHNSKQQLNKSRLEQLSQPRRLKTQGPEKEQEMPSFRPSLSKKSLEQMSNCMYDVATRNQLWLEQREQKIQKMRQEEEQEKERKDNCTYYPSLCSYKGENNPNISRFGREGLVNYFDRVSCVKKSTSRVKLQSGKENKQGCMNMSKESYFSKASNKQKYDLAVKQLHSRIMGLKI